MVERETEIGREIRERRENREGRRENDSFILFYCVIYNILMYCI